eukprot:m.106125 g.106125  ORF g.106125 m.106125 type:complete len:77 (-) comp21063_c0_seq2:74-304(-)
MIPTAPITLTATVDSAGRATGTGAVPPGGADGMSAIDSISGMRRPQVDLIKRFSLTHGSEDSSLLFVQPVPFVQAM